ncbi:MAG: aconitase family protein [Megasphaera sp.]|jgi:3-isopropylmalate/(R)-2-methylmalate dehydratase large subunit|nr:aconitase family protein [Megasphaera sp.]MCI1247483.1 aconitase family protein [Megasphaera sp.]
MDVLARKLKDLTKVKADWCLLTDSISEMDLDILVQAKVKNPSAVLVTVDHDTPSGTVAVAHKQKRIRDFAKKWQMPYRYGAGIGYYIAMEEFIHAGDIVVCNGTHAATVGAVGALGIRSDAAGLKKILEGELVHLTATEIVPVNVTGKFDDIVSAKDFSLMLIHEKKYAGKIMALYAPDFTFADKVTICNLLPSGGIRSAYFTMEKQADGFSYRTEDVQPLAVLPDGFSKIASSSCIDGIRVNQVFIGGCAGGSIEVLRKAAQLLKNKKVSKYVRVIIAPASAKIYAQAIDEGLIEVFMAAQVLVMNQGCSACWAQSQGRCDTNEVFVTTGSINTKYWCGAQNNGIYITSPASAVKAALTGFYYEN